jgi:protein ImuA
VARACGPSFFAYFIDHVPYLFYSFVNMTPSLTETRICVSGSQKLAHLRASLADAGLSSSQTHARIPLGCPSADAALKGGLQQGALHEIFAASGHEAAATGFACAAALRLSGAKHLLWIRQDFSALEQGEIAPTGLIEFGVNPSRVLILGVANASDAVRAAKDALSSRALGAIVIETIGKPKILDLVTSRRLTLAASKQGVTALLLRFGAEPDASAAETRWCVRAAHSHPNDEDWGKPIFETDLVRNRHGSTGHWVMEWSCDDGFFKERPADRGAVVSASSDRPLAAAMEDARRERAARIA